MKDNKGRQISFLRPIRIIHLASAEELRNNCKQNVLFSVYISSSVVLMACNLTHNIFRIVIFCFLYKRKFQGDLIYNRGTTLVSYCSTINVLLFNSVAINETDRLTLPSAYWSGCMFYSFMKMLPDFDPVPLI
jgi:hypothetical protein